MEKQEYLLQGKSETKVCRKCKDVLTNSNWWGSRKGAKDYICVTCIKKHRHDYYTDNKERVRAVQRLYYKRRKEVYTNSRLKGDYGITLDQYNQLLESQNNVCAICGGTEAGGNQYGKVRMAIDHNHLTGKVRGLLCCKCNMALGGLDVDIKGTELLYKSIKYIKDNNCA